MAAKKARSRRKAATRRKAGAGTARKRKAKARTKPRASGRRPAASRRRKAAGSARGKSRKNRKKKSARRPARAATRRATKRRKPPAKTGRRATTVAGTKKTTAKKTTARKKTARNKKTTKAARSRGSGKAARRAAAPKSQAGRSVRGKPPVLDRERRRLPEPERAAAAEPVPTAEPAAREDGAGPDERLLRSARAGRDELRQNLGRHTATGPKLTGGDVDANWHDAYAVGDEAPGGDNPTPDQDRVDEIGRALGVTYQDSQELQGGDEITERDRHRWEYDPASSDDWPHDKKDK